jgi:hypothetical protein
MRARTLLLVAALVTATVVAVPVSAQQQRFALGLSGGTLGGSLSASFRPLPHLGLRATYNRGSHTRNFQERDVNYDLTLYSDSVGALVDLYPTGGAFRITGGALINRNRVEGRTTENNVVTINGQQYPAALVGYLTAQARGNRTAPFAGIGWAPSRRRWGFTFDVGAAYHGAPKLTAQAHPTIPALVPASFYQNLEAERVKEERDIAKYKWYPAVQLGLTFGF